MGYYRESKLLEKIESLQQEYTKIGTTPQRKYIIEQHILQLQRDVGRLGLTKEDQITPEKK